MKNLRQRFPRSGPEWSVRPEVTGMFTRPEAERLALRSALRDGEIFTQLVRGQFAGLTHSTSVPFSLELP